MCPRRSAVPHNIFHNILNQTQGRLLLPKKQLALRLVAPRDVYVMHCDVTYTAQPREKALGDLVPVARTGNAHSHSMFPTTFPYPI
jgi:hypothetical protein